MDVAGVEGVAKQLHKIADNEADCVVIRKLIWAPPGGLQWMGRILELQRASGVTHVSKPLSDPVESSPNSLLANAINGLHRYFLFLFCGGRRFIGFADKSSAGQIRPYIKMNVVLIRLELFIFLLVLRDICWERSYNLQKSTHKTCSAMMSVRHLFKNLKKRPACWKQYIRLPCVLLVAPTLGRRFSFFVSIKGVWYYKMQVK